MGKDNWIYTYYQGIKNGKYTVGRWIELVYEYIVHGFEEKLFFFDAKKAADAIEWIETHCFHTEGYCIFISFLIGSFYMPNSSLLHCRQMLYCLSH